MAFTPKKGAGPLIERVAFEAMQKQQDGYGNFVDAFVEQFRTRAAFLPIQPSAARAEAVIADKLTGRQAYVVQIRVSVSSQAIDTDWRMIDLSDATPYNVRAKNRSTDRAYFDLVVESGVAQ